MLKNLKTPMLLAFTLMLTMVGIWFYPTESAAQDTRQSAGGHGALLVRDERGKEVRRQFSFNARTNADGTVSGQAVLHNASFTGANGKTYKSTFEISCLKIVGNTAVVGGTVRRTNDPNLSDSAFFIVQDNGEPGKNTDKISLVYFDSVVGPEACQNTGINDFPLIPIESGNIQVRGDSAP